MLVWYHRRTCTYNYSDLQNRLPDTLENVLPISFVRKAIRRCFRFISGYRLNLTGPLLEFVVKFKSHRAIPSDMKQVIAEDFKAKSIAKKNYHNKYGFKQRVRNTTCNVILAPNFMFLELKNDWRFLSFSDVWGCTAPKHRLYVYSLVCCCLRQFHF